MENAEIVLNIQNHMDKKGCASLIDAIKIKSTAEMAPARIVRNTRDSKATGKFVDLTYATKGKKYWKTEHAKNVVNTPDPVKTERNAFHQNVHNYRNYLEMAHANFVHRLQGHKVMPNIVELIRAMKDRN